LKQKFRTAELNKPVDTARTTRYLDIAIFADGLNKEHYLLDVEYDGQNHKFRKREDQRRDKELKQIGWLTVRINKNNLDKALEIVANAIKNYDKLIERE
jgi:very-short-patch-repair endonuclease